MMLAEEEEQNAFVDVCGDNDETGDKENAGAHFEGGQSAGPGNNFGQFGDRVLSSSNQFVVLPIQKGLAMPFNPTTKMSQNLPQNPPNCPSTMMAGENSENDENDGAEGNPTDPEENPSKRSSLSQVSRKEKSLGKLCGPFLARVGQEASAGRDVHLETIARNMCVEKRRIYDIVNVMEALEVMQKTNKSFYKWHGLGRLPMLMHALQSEAQRGQLPKRIADAEGAMCKFAEFVDATNKIQQQEKEMAAAQNLPKSSNLSEEMPPGTANLAIFPLEGSPMEEADPAFGPMASRDRCGKNSLAQLCRRFLMVLLCNPHRRRVSLDVVSTLLINDPADSANAFEPPSRSRCRRLYDIANVLVEMRLVQKRNSMFGTKKIPLFEYCGPEPDANPSGAERRMREFQQRSGLALAAFGHGQQPTEEGTSGEAEIGNDKAAENPTNSTTLKRKREENEMPESARLFPNSNSTKVTKKIDGPGPFDSEKNPHPFAASNAEKNERPQNEGPIKMETKDEGPPAAKRPRRILGEKQMNQQKTQNEQQTQQSLPRPQPLLPAFLQPSNLPPLAPSTGSASSLPPFSPFAPIPLLQPFGPSQLPAAHFWPSTSHSQQQLAFAAADRLAHQILAAYSTGQLAQISSIPQIPAIPLNPVPSQAKMRHSVQSILGCSQKENIAAGNGGSPRAFKPPSSFPPQNNGPKGTTANRALPFGQKQPKAFGNDQQWGK